MKKFKKILLMLVLVTLICGWAVISLASSNVGDPSEIVNLEDRTNTDKTQTNNANQSRSNIPATNTNTNTNTNTSLPKTGANDTAMWLLVAVCGVSAVYTYKKIRDYNV